MINWIIDGIGQGLIIGIFAIIVILFIRLINNGMNRYDRWINKREEFKDVQKTIHEKR